MDDTQRALEFEALVNTCSAINIEAMGMKYENEQRIICEQSMAYGEEAFQEKANEIRDIVKKLRDLKASCQQSY